MKLPVSSLKLVILLSSVFFLTKSLLLALSPQRIYAENMADSLGASGLKEGDAFILAPSSRAEILADIEIQPDLLDYSFPFILSILLFHLIATVIITPILLQSKFKYEKAIKSQAFYKLAQEILNNLNLYASLTKKELNEIVNNDTREYIIDIFSDPFYPKILNLMSLDFARAIHNEASSLDIAKEVSQILCGISGLLIKAEIFKNLMSTFYLPKEREWYTKTIQSRYDLDSEQAKIIIGKILMPESRPTLFELTEDYFLLLFNEERCRETDMKKWLYSICEKIYPKLSSNNPPLPFFKFSKKNS